jgi:hypothetical protein
LQAAPNGKRDAGGIDRYSVGPGDSLSLSQDSSCLPSLGNAEVSFPIKIMVLYTRGAGDFYD